MAASGRCPTALPRRSGVTSSIRRRAARARSCRRRPRFRAATRRRRRTVRSDARSGTDLRARGCVERRPTAAGRELVRHVTGHHADEQARRRRAGHPASNGAGVQHATARVACPSGNAMTRRLIGHSCSTRCRMRARWRARRSGRKRRVGRGGGRRRDLIAASGEAPRGAAQIGQDARHRLAVAGTVRRTAAIS